MTRIRAVLIGLALVITNIMGIIFLIPENVSAEVYVSGSISSDTTWTAVNSPYIVVGNVTVEIGVTLTIEPGVEVKFNGSFSLIVNGTLNATGSSSAPINFTSNQTTPSKGNWEGIKLRGENNTLDYCQILWGNNPLYIQDSNTNNSIRNSTIFNNSGDGIYLNNTSLNTFYNITVYSNEGYGLIINSSENNTISNSAINQNGLSGIYFSLSSYNRIENTNISNNSQDAIYLEQSTYNTFRNNILINNNWTGINLTSSSSNNTIKINNITSNNNSGILITGNSNTNKISRNEISNNVEDGINISGATANLIHHNNFDSNGQNAYDSTNQLNLWDDGMEGNWWSDYGGSDGDGDGIGDTPHDIPGGGSKDFYPLVNPMNINAPIIEGTIPLNGTQNVSVTPQISITFSNEMNKSATENATSISGGLTPTYFFWSNNNMTMTFEPSLTLDSKTLYEVNVSTTAKDLLENTLHVNYQFVFTTEDADPPEITSTTPVNGSTGIAINANIVVIFSEAIDDTTVTYTCSPDPGGWSVVWSGGNTTATYSHNNFDSETLYTFEITAAKDLAGNDLVAGAVPNPFEFITEDNTPPNITVTSPINGSINVLISVNIVVTFSEEMNTSSVTYTCTPDPGGWSVVWSAGNTTATYSHNDFNSETLYTFNITGGKDLAGNDLVDGAVPNPFEFTTEDAVAPQISSTTPVNGTIDVLITADIVVIFNEEMNTSSVTYTCTPDPGGWSVVWSAGNTTATYSHNDFDSETLYTFQITGGKDVAGNDLVAGSVPNPWGFTTEDVAGPQIISTTPSNGTIDVLITADIVVIFNEEMNTSSVTYTSTPDPSGWSVVWSAGNTTATYSHNDFNSETTYTFEITGGKDLAGNDLVAGAVPNPWEFTTEDIIAPQISSTTPANGTIDVSITANIVVIFSEEMNTSSVTYTNSPDPGGWSVVWSAGNTTATYSHNDFDSETLYTFTITGGKDLKGNDLVDGVVPNPFEFTTEDAVAPQISSTTPVNGTIDVLITADIVVIFNEEMNTSSVTYTCTPDPGGWSVVWSAGNTTATYSHNDFDSETLYTFQITGGKDVAGNVLVAGVVPNPWEFTTEDIVAPQISSTTPANGTVDVIITTNIVVVFSEEMNTSSVTYTCTPDPGGWSVFWSAGNITATYSHNNFDSKTTYTFEITGAKDPSGNDLIAGAVPNPWTFTTEDVISPQISSTTPVNGTIDVLINANIVVVFSEEMNTSSVTYTSTPDPGGWGVVWSIGNTTATYSHNDFDSETTYTFEITVAKDLAGNDLVAGAVPNPWEFTTGDVIAPQISSTIPINGTIDVLISADIVVTFSEQMNTSSVTYTSIPNPGGWSVVWSGGNTIATYSHNDFASETMYTFEITAAKDPAGNDLVAGAIPNPWTFTTEDVVGPQIISTTPANGTIDVIISADVVVAFSEEMNTSSVTYTCTPDPGGWSVVWSGGSTIATYSHNNLNGETIYLFEITGAKDISGNDLVAGIAPNPWSFSTEDIQMPTIISTTPANGSLNVAQTANIIVTFSEAMNTSSVQFTCSPNPGGWFVTWSGGDTIATFTHDPFDDYNTYIFHIASGKDLAGNNLSSGAVLNPFSFTTTDSIPPSISSTSPLNGSVNIGLTQNIIVTFSEQMNTSSLTYSCFPDPGGWAVAWSSGDTVATLSHSSFNDKTAYTFLIANVKDVAGNNLVGGGVFNPWTFTTLDSTSPVIIATSPSNNSLNVAQAADIVVTFSEKMNTASVAFLCTPDPGGWSVSWNAPNTIVTFTHNAFDEFTSYTFLIVAAEDVAGNPLGAGALPNPWSFKTKDITVPIITATTPPSGALNIGLNQNVIVTFSEAMNNITLTHTCLPDPSGWTVMWSGGNTVATFSHNPFASDTTYTFQITGAKDQTGNNLVAGGIPNPWSFTTLDSISPFITLCSPTNGSMGVDLNQNVIVLFSEAMNISSVTYTSIPDPGGWNMVWNGGNTVCTFSHNNFQKSTGYIFQIISGKDIAGNSLVAGAVPNPWSFTTASNIAPTIISSPILSANEDMQYIYDAEATDGDGSALTYILTTFPTGMTINATTGLITWTPTNNQVGANNVVVLVSDGEGGTDSQSFTITVANENDPPLISSTPPTSALEDALYTYDVDALDIDGDSLTFSLNTYPVGMVIDNVSGLITWMPINSQVGSNSVVVVVSDGNGGSDTQSFIITVTNTNDPPAIISTPITTATEDELYVYDVQATDVDTDDTLTFILTSYPIGMIINTTTGIIEWTPTNAQVGANSVNLEVMDENGTKAAQSFTIMVTNANDLPTITTTPITTAFEDELYTYDVEASDVDGDILTFSLSTYPTGMVIDNSSGLISWVPNNSQVGANSVVILVSDGKGGADTQSFTVTVENVNDPPSVTSIPITTAFEDSQYFYDVDAIDIDSSDTLSYFLTVYPMGMVIDSLSGMIQWTPTNDHVGANGVVVLVLDGKGGNATQSFIITVSNTNDAPDITSLPVTAATEDVQYTYDVEANDAEGDTLTFSLSTYPSGMVINGASGLITWTPTNSHVGPNSVVVLVSDGKGGTDTQSFTITVTNTNDPPTITSTPITSATEDQTYTYDVQASDIDSDDTLTYTLTTYPFGMTINQSTGVITWTPTNSQIGTNSVTVLVSDTSSANHSQTFTITVTNTNDPPTIISTPILTATEDTQYSYDVEAMDLDVGNILSYSLTTKPSGMTVDSATGLILWTPTNAQVGSHNVVVFVQDGYGGSDTQSFSIIVSNSNDPPTITSSPITTATDDTLYTYDVDAIDVDVGDTLTYSLSASPAGMTINASSGLVKWTPTDDHVGTVSVTILVTDSQGGFDTQAYLISVADLNDPPSIISSALTTATEDAGYTYDVNAFDPDSDLLAFSLTTYPAGMTIDGVTGLILWTPSNVQVGANSVVVFVSDGNGGTVTQSFTITVTNTNDPPTITSNPIMTATEDQLYVYDVQATDVDAGDSLTYTLISFPTGMLIDAASGLISWTPTNDNVGVNSIIVFVADKNGGNDTQSFTINVSNTNDVPIIISTPIAAAVEDVVYKYDVNATDIDLGNTLIYSLTTYPDTMVIDSATGMITWMPENDDVGINTVTVRVIDQKGGVVTQSFSITVSNVNDPPTIISVPYTMASQGVLYTYDVDATEVDLADALTYNLMEFPQGMVINSSTGRITWSPTNAQVGGNSVLVEVFDKYGGRDTQTFVITVSNVNDPPTFTSQPITIATEEKEYFYEIEGVDIDGDILTYSIVNGPSGMEIESAAGTLTWTPTNDQVGSHPIVVRVSDGKGGSAKQTFTISVENVNDPPTIISTAVTNAKEDVVYAYSVEASDMDPTHDNLTFELAVYPEGMKINPATGIINWTPADDQVGDNSVIVIVSDGKGGSDTQSFVINVLNVNDAPIFTSAPIRTAVEEVQYTYDVNAIDVDFGDTLVYNLSYFPSGMEIDVQTGIINWTPTDAQANIIHQIVVMVTDDHGAFATQSFSITVVNVNDRPMMFDMRVVPESGSDKDKYTFSLTYMDPDNDPGIVKVIIDTVEYEMIRGSGENTTGVIYSLQVNLVARNHTYYFAIDDGQGHTVISDLSEISVISTKGDEREDLLPIPDWLLVLILVIIILVILIYLTGVKRNLKRQKQALQMAEEYQQNQIRQQQLRSAGAGQPVMRTSIQKPKESLESEEPDESDELDEPLLTFSK